MDKGVVLSVAGSGKTSYIIDSLNLETRSLIVTYTENNINNIKSRVIKKYGYLPQNIYIMSYFTFLYKFCYKPLLAYKRELDGIYWLTPPEWTARMNRNDSRYYFHSSNRVYHNRLAKLLEMQKVEGEISERINKYFDIVYIDEVQDFGGHDFNLLMHISENLTHMILVGDFFQHTFDTSRDGTTNINLYNDLSKYIGRLKSNGFIVDDNMLSKSYRCSPTVCRFITDKLTISISSHRDDVTQVKEVEEVNEIDCIVRDPKIVKLFYQSHVNYNMTSLNWGASKGLDDFTDICVVLNKKSYELFKSGKLDELNPTTRNKLYVACTRANRHLYFIEEKKLVKYKNNTKVVK